MWLTSCVVCPAFGLLGLKGLACGGTASKPSAVSLAGMEEHFVLHAKKRDFKSFFCSEFDRTAFKNLQVAHCK